MECCITTARVCARLGQKKSFLIKRKLLIFLRKTINCVNFTCASHIFCHLLKNCKSLFLFDFKRTVNVIISRKLCSSTWQKGETLKEPSSHPQSSKLSLPDTTNTKVLCIHAPFWYWTLHKQCGNVCITVYLK